MMPDDLVQDIEKDSNLKTYDQAYKYVIQQIPVRKNRQGIKKKHKGPDDMDVDLTQEEEKEEGKEEEKESGCGGEELDTLKGGGKGGGFQGYCHLCWKWGHKRDQCYDNPAKGKSKGKGDGGKAKGKGKSPDGGKAGWYQNQNQGKGGWYGNGSWQSKGGGWKGKGYGKSAGGYTLISMEMEAQLVDTIKTLGTDTGRDSFYFMKRKRIL